MAIDTFRFGIPQDNRDPTAAACDVTGLPIIPEQEFGRVVVILGANGAGKSRLLHSLSRTSTVGGEIRPAVYVEGGRSIRLDLRDDHKGQYKARKYEQRDNLTNRMSHMLYLLESERDADEMVHADALLQWDKSNGELKDKPTRRKSKFDELCEAFNRLFPKLTIEAARNPLTISNSLTHRNSPWQWNCTSAGKQYSISQLSDGEKQSFCLLGDVGLMSPEKPMIIVDEPELNLHPSLALNLWNLIEQLNKDAVFVYGTHSLSFAMRSNVTDIVILKDGQEPPICLKSPAAFDGQELEPFLGAIPAIATAGRLAVVEGHDTSFDHDFYQWVLGLNTTILSVGSCDNVRGAVKHSGVWKKIGDQKIFGVMDRDYRSDEQLKNIAPAGCYLLEYHEAESYLCHPDLLVEATKRSGRRKTRKEFLDGLVFQCQNLLVDTAIRRSIAKTEVRLRVGREGGDDWPKNIEAAKTAMRGWAAIESVRANDFENRAVANLDSEIETCQQAIDEANIDKMLALFPGKALLGRMAALARFDETTLLNSVSELNANNFPHLVKIFDAARSELG